MDSSPVDRIVCYCYQVSHRQILKAIEEKNLQTANEIRKCTGAGSGCGSCRTDVEEILEIHQAKIMREIEHEKRKQLPKNVFKPQSPLPSVVVSNTVLSNSDNADTCHIVIKNPNSVYPFAEGQSLGILPPGIDSKGHANHVRLYSIASSGFGDVEAEPTISICVKRVVYQEKESGKTIKGVCSNYLCDLKPGDPVQLTGPVGQSFLLPEDPSANLILIATGTGIAPFRSFYKNLFNPHRTPRFTGNVYLFFGCPYSNGILYKNELDELSKTNRNFHVKYAISREQKNADGSKKYVHHTLQQNMGEIFPLLFSPKTFVYLCGVKGMEEGVNQVFKAAAEVRRLNWETLYQKFKKEEKRWEVEVY